MPAWVIPAISAAAGLIGQGIAKGKDQRQLRQQEKLGQIQMSQNKEMMEFGQGLQMKMWHDTGYGAQKKQMSEAGLNPGLMYGMGGGGGQSVGSPGTGGIAGGMAPAGSGNETETMMGMGLQVAQQMALQEAQKENIQADTELKKQEAGIVPTKSENIKASTGKVISETTGQELKNKFDNESMTDRLSKISAEAVTEVQRAQQMVNQTNVSDRTINDQVKQIKQNAIGKVLDNVLTKVETTKKGQEIEKIKSEMRKIAADIEQGWQRGNNEVQRTVIMERLGKSGLDLAEQGQVLNALTGILSMGSKTIPNTTTNEWWSTDENGNQRSGGGYSKNK